MSNFDPNANAWGTPYVQTRSAAEVDQGLRSFMLGVYNNMILGLAISGLVAMGTNMLATTTNAAGRSVLTPIGQMLYVSPLKWVIMLAPLAFILLFTFRADKMSASSARAMFFAFAAVMGDWLAKGRMVYREDMIDGLEQAPQAFIGLLRGENFGKRVIRVDPALPPGLAAAGSVVS